MEITVNKELKLLETAIELYFSDAPSTHALAIESYEYYKGEGVIDHIKADHKNYLLESLKYINEGNKKVTEYLLFNACINYGKTNERLPINLEIYHYWYVMNNLDNFDFPEDMDLEEYSLDVSNISKKEFFLSIKNQ